MEAALGFMAAIARRGVGAEGLGRCLKEGGLRILGVRAQRDPGGDRGHLLQRGRKTRRRRETRLTRWDRGVSGGARVRSGHADDARAGPRDERVGLLCARRAEADCGAGLRAGKRFAGLSGEEGGSAREDCCCRWFVGRCACGLSGSWLLRFAGEVVDGLCAWAGVASWLRGGEIQAAG